ncbi:hypothetical protein ABZ749_22460, partial [Micromonospora sp. NPDC047753]|uniref:hypothetical protein n=1 Tax=Micromonospora sp. NPDC047753 TaxID=3154817 RepID=UPI003405FA1F
MQGRRRHALPVHRVERRDGVADADQAGREPLERVEVPSSTVGMVVGLDVADHLLVGDLAELRWELLAQAADEVIRGTPRAVVAVTGHHGHPPAVLDGEERGPGHVHPRFRRVQSQDDSRGRGDLRTAEQGCRIVEVHCHPPGDRPVPVGLLQPVRESAGPSHGVHHEVGAFDPGHPIDLAADPGDRGAVEHEAGGAGGDRLDVGQPEHLLADQALQQRSTARQTVGVVGDDDLQTPVEVVAPGLGRRLDRSARQCVVAESGEQALQLEEAAGQQRVQLCPLGYAGPRAGHDHHRPGWRRHRGPAALLRRGAL